VPCYFLGRLSYLPGAPCYFLDRPSYLLGAPSYFLGRPTATGGALVGEFFDRMDRILQEFLVNHRRRSVQICGFFSDLLPLALLNILSSCQNVIAHRPVGISTGMTLFPWRR